MAPVPAFGVPESVAVPSLLLTNVTPPGSAPVSLMFIDAPLGKPVAVTVNVPAVPTLNVALFGLVIDGGSCTVSVKLCVPFGVTPLFAVMVIAYVPPVPAFGMPASVAVPLPLSTNVTPPGSAPVSLRTIDAPLGKPVVVTVNVPATPTLNVAAFALVMAGAWLIVRVKDWLAFGRLPLAAPKVIAYVPPVPAFGVPESVAVPLPLLTKVTPPGSTPVSLIVGAGKPVVVTVKVPGAPTVKAALFALVIAGASFTVRVKLWFAFGAMPWFAVIVMT